MDPRSEATVADLPPVDSPSGDSSAAASRETAGLSARWEERSVGRALEVVGRDQILERSRKIVDAAYELLDEEGLEGLTIRAVLNRTGLSRRAFYERFEGKDDLVLAVFEQTIRAAADRFSEQIGTLDDPLEKLKLLVTFIVRGRSLLMEGGHSGRRGAALSREHLRLAEARPSDLQAALAPLIDVITQALADGMAVGVIRPADPRRLAKLVYNLVSTTVHTELLAEEAAGIDVVPSAQLAAEVWEFCRRAVSV